MKKIENIDDLRAALRRLDSFFASEDKNRVRATINEVSDLCSAIAEFADQKEVEIPADIFKEFDNEGRRAALIFTSYAIRDMVLDNSLTEKFSKS